MKRSYEQALAWLTSLQYDPRQWDALTWLVVVAVLLVFAAFVLASGRRRRGAAGPQFLLTNGQIALVGDAPRAAPADGGRRSPALLRAPDDADYQLRVTVNNLNAYPVQLLEIAVRTDAGGLPVVADASAVVPPNGAVDVVADITDLPGERGTLELYLYNTRVAPRSLRLLAPLDWEPWNQRYRVRATAQRVEAARVVASEARQRQERAAIRRGRAREWVAGAAQGVSERAGELSRDLAARGQRAVQERRARREAARAAEQREGPFSVPLPPSGSRQRPTSLDEEQRQVRPPARGDEAREREEEARAPDDLELKDRESEPRPRLDFPDEF